MSRILTLIALALATAAVAASVAGADNGAKVDPFAVSYLAGQGLTPSEITSWTTGDCSGQNKAASCYAMLESSSTEITSSSGFSWGDAGIGAAATLGIVFLIGALGAALVTRRHRHDPFAPA